MSKTMTIIMISVGSDCTFDTSESSSYAYLHGHIYNEILKAYEVIHDDIGMSKN